MPPSLDAIDIPSEIRKLTLEIEKAKKQLEGTMKKLSNPQFLQNAKKEAIVKEEGKKAEFEELISKNEEHIELLRKLG